MHLNLVLHNLNQLEPDDDLAKPGQPDDGPPKPLEAAASLTKSI